MLDPLALMQVALATIVVSTPDLAAQSTLEGPAGHLFVCGGGRLPAEVIEAFVAAAGGADARLVVVPTASSGADADDVEAEYGAHWLERGIGAVEILHTRDRAIADTEAFAAPLRRATAVWLSGGDQSRLAEAYGGTAVEAEILAVLARGGAVGGTSAGAAIQSPVMIAGGNPNPDLARGFALLPGTVVDQHFRARDRQPRLREALRQHPTLVGLGIDEGTAFVVHGRTGRVLGEGAVSVFMRPGAGRPAAERALRRGSVVDLTQLRRAAAARAADEPLVSGTGVGVAGEGTLVLGGGGQLPPEVLARFVAAAGGAAARIVVVPTAAGDAAARAARGARRELERAGAEHVEVFHESDRSRLGDPDVLAPLADADGVWFTGGRQWRLIDAYAGTPAEAAFRAVLARGGAIGGSSAGTSVQAEVMVRGHPLGNTVMLAEGYERGFGFLTGAAVDQHFAQRDREPDLRAVVAAHPDVLGLGVDEGTALFVTGDRAEVVGAHGVTVLDARGGGAVRAARHGAGSSFRLSRGD